MSYDTERLRERLLDLGRSRNRERDQRRQAEVLLAGLMPLGQAESATEILAVLVDVLREFLGFEEAFLLVEVDGGIDSASKRMSAAVSKSRCSSAMRAGMAALA